MYHHEARGASFQTYTLFIFIWSANIQQNTSKYRINFTQFQNKWRISVENCRIESIGQLCRWKCARKVGIVFVDVFVFNPFWSSTSSHIHGDGALFIEELADHNISQYTSIYKTAWLCSQSQKCRDDESSRILLDIHPPLTWESHDFSGGDSTTWPSHSYKMVQEIEDHLTKSFQACNPTLQDVAWLSSRLRHGSGWKKRMEQECLRQVTAANTTDGWLHILKCVLKIIQIYMDLWYNIYIYVTW